MVKRDDQLPSGERSSCLSVRIIVGVVILGLFVIRPLAVEKTLLSSVDLVSHQHEKSISSVNATYVALKSQIAFSGLTTNVDADHSDKSWMIDSKTPSASPRKSSQIKDPFLHQIDQYFEALHFKLSEIQWIREYLYWHYEMRMNFPEETLFENTTGPNVTIVYFDPKTQKGGLTDRMKSLGHLVYSAYQEKNMLLFKWYDGPLPLESFVMPHLLNFTVPSHPNTTTPDQLRESYGESGGRIKLVKFVNQLGNYLHPYGIIWNALFQPSCLVQQATDDAMTRLGLVEGKFDAVHCRIGHPAYRNKIKYASSKDKVIDQQGGYKFEGINREGAMKTAIHGIQCVEWVAKKHYTSNNSDIEDSQRTIYFFSDLPDLVRTVVTPSTLAVRGKSQHSLVDELMKLGSHIKVVGRTNVSIAHLENRKEDTSPDAFQSTFVDLYIAAQARCIALGVGRFAYMAAKLSGTTCWTRHQIPKSSVGARWGMTQMSREVPECQMGKP